LERIAGRITAIQKAAPRKPGSRRDPRAWTRRFLQLTLTLAGAAMLAGTVPAAAQPPEGKTAQKAPG